MTDLWEGSTSAGGDQATLSLEGLTKVMDELLATRVPYFNVIVSPYVQRDDVFIVFPERDRIKPIDYTPLIEDDLRTFHFRHFCQSVPISTLTPYYSLAVDESTPVIEDRFEKMVIAYAILFFFVVALALWGTM